MKVRREVKRLVNESAPYSELSELEDVQQRIDRVAEDLTSGEHRYAVIDTQELAELLEVDLDDVGGALGYEYRERLYSDSMIDLLHYSKPQPDPAHSSEASG